MMKIEKGLPPNIEEIKKVFNVDEGVVYTYGDTIYNPTEFDVPNHLMAHEMEHMRQQGDDPKAWWDRYLVDKVFRQEQEMEAYGMQYAYIQRTFPVRAAKQLLFYITRDFAGPIYGNLMSYHEAESLIRHEAKRITALTKTLGV